MEIPYHKLMLLDATSHSVVVVEGPSGNLLAEIPLPERLSPIDLSLNPMGNQAVISLSDSSGAGTFLFIDLDNFSAREFNPEAPAPAKFAFGEDISKVYLTDQEGNLFLCNLDTGGMSPRPTPPGAGYCAGIISDSANLFGVWERPGGGILAVFDHAGILQSEYSLGGIPQGISLDRNGRIIVPFAGTAFSGEGVLILCPEPFVIPLSCCHCYRSIKTGPIHAISDTFSNHTYIVCEDSGTIVAIDLEKKMISSTITVGRSISRLAVLPDGKFAVASSNRFADLCLIDLVNARLISFTSDSHEILSPLAIIN